MPRQLWSSLQIVIAVAVLRAATLFIPVFNQDECYIAVQAQVVNAGGALYRDIFDRKPPLVQHIYAAVFRAVGSDSLIAVHVLAILWVAATALVLAAIMRRRAGPREARWAAWLFVLASMMLLPRDALAANFELWMLLPLCGAMLAGGRGRPLLDLVAGALLAVAVFMKQPALVTVVPLAYTIWRAPHRAAGLACMLGGLAAVAGLVIATHDPRMLDWGFFGTTGYMATDDLVFALRLAVMWTGSFVVASLGLWWLVVRHARSSGARADLDLWLWLATALFGVAAGLRFLGHYHLQLVPAACLLAARPAAALAPHVRRRVITALVVPALACAVLGFVIPNYVHDVSYPRAAAYVQAHTRATDRMFVWGHFPELYWAAQRLPAGRFVHTGFVTGHSGARAIQPGDVRAASPGAWDTLFADLERDPPAYVLDLAPGGMRQPVEYAIDRYPRLASWLAQGYQLEVIIDGIWLYRRRD